MESAAFVKNPFPVFSRRLFKIEYDR